MKDLIKIYDVTMLSQSKVYQIKSYLYRYIGNDDHKIGHEKYYFRPLERQRVTKRLVLSRNKVYCKVYEVPGYLPPSKNTAAASNGIQLSLF